MLKSDKFWCKNIKKSHKITQNHTKSHKITQNHTLNFSHILRDFFDDFDAEIEQSFTKKPKKNGFGVGSCKNLLPLHRN